MSLDLTIQCEQLANKIHTIDETETEHMKGYNDRIQDTMIHT